MNGFAKTRFDTEANENSEIYGLLRSYGESRVNLTTKFHETS